MRTDLPKALVTADDRPLIHYSTSEFVPYARSVLVVVREEHKSSFVGTHWHSVVKPTYVVQTNLTGTAEAVRLGLLASSSKWLVVVWADHVGASAFPLDAILVEMNSEADLVLPVVERPDPYVYFEVLDHRITRFNETHRGAPSVAKGLSDCGVFALRRDAVLGPLSEFVHDHSGAEELNFLQFFASCHADSLRSRLLRLEDFRLTIGVNSPDDLDQLGALL